jgi:cation-transporting ATPase 13A3/4/5
MLKLYEGISESKANMISKIFEKNSINLKSKTILQLVLDQTVHPFNVFQLLSVIIWCCEEYVMYATCILLMTIISLIMTVKETKANNEKIREVARNSQILSIKRDGKCK